MTYKKEYMNTISKFSFATILSVSLVACGGGAAKDDKGKLTDMKVKLEKLKKDKDTFSITSQLNKVSNSNVNLSEFKNLFYIDKVKNLI